MWQRAADGKTTKGQDIVYVPRPDTTPETEAEALVTVYRFLLDCHTAKKDAAAEPSGQND